MGKRSCRKPTEVAVSQGTLYLATGIRVDDTGSVHGYFRIRYETIFIWPESRKTCLNPICVMREMFILKYIFVWVDFVIW